MSVLSNASILLYIELAIQNAINVFDRSHHYLTNQLQRQNHQLLARYQNYWQITLHVFDFAEFQFLCCHCCCFTLLNRLVVLTIFLLVTLIYYD